ncbi:unnamed protein product [Peniophora sp. CBMAI 1063]|nr:unnamed protein product [Peniophora sp. CBMAI 1063]
MSFTTPSLLDAAALVVALYVAKRLFSRLTSNNLPLPPGPSGLPMIGNALEMPTVNPYKVYEEWGQKYGPIMHLSALGLSFIVINDLSIATELLEKRAAIYSDRPTLPMAGELSGWDPSLPLLHYDDRWRAQRKYFHTFLGALISLRLMRAPQTLDQSIRKATAGVIMKITYGYDALPDDDPLVTLVSEAIMEYFGGLTEPSKVWLVDFFPVLKHIPTWFPGAGFRSIAAKSADMAHKMSQVPFDLVKERMKQDTSQPCMAADLLEQSTGGEDEEREIKWAATSMYGGAADTSYSSTSSFFLAMTLFPEAQRKAQAEIDAVVGHDRFPTLADRPNLPYTEGLFKEVIRWAPVVPMGLPHRLPRRCLRGVPPTFRRRHPNQHIRDAS